MIQEHPDLGLNIIQHVGFLGEAREIIAQHHERYDGTGYPKGLQGEAIHLGARILAVADSYDAMSSERPYHLPMNKEKIMDEIRKQAGLPIRSPGCGDIFNPFRSRRKRKIRVSLDQFKELVTRALEEIPEEFLEKLENLDDFRRRGPLPGTVKGIGDVRPRPSFRIVSGGPHFGKKFFPGPEPPGPDHPVSTTHPFHLPHSK